MSAISSRCPTTMRSHTARSAGLASCVGAQPAISTAWAWWAIMPVTKCTSAALYPGRPPFAWARAAGTMSASAPIPTVQALVMMRPDPLLTKRAKAAGGARVGQDGSGRGAPTRLRSGPVQEHEARHDVRKDPVQGVTHRVRVAIDRPKDLHAEQGGEEHQHEGLPGHRPVYPAPRNEPAALRHRSPPKSADNPVEKRKRDRQERESDLLPVDPARQCTL